MYCRISQDRDGQALGVARQEADCRELVQRLGWSVAGLYVDNDLSAHSGKRRPEWERLLADAQAGVVDAVVAWHPDRLVRRPKDLERFIEVVERARAKVATVTAGHFDLGTPTGRATARTVTAWANFESEHKSERIRRKLDELAAAGKVTNGGPRPFGFLLDRVTLDEAEAALIREAARDVAAGAPLRAVTRRWNDAGVKTSTGRSWTVQALRWMLMSGRIAGLKERNREVVGKAVWPAIISEEEHRQLRAVLGNRSRLTTTSHARVHLLTGLLYCGRCGARRRPRGSAARQKYVCQPKAEGGCNGVAVGTRDADELISSLVLARMEEVEPVDLEDDEETDLIEQIRRDEQWLVDLSDAYADDPDSDPLEMRRAGAKVRQRLTEARSELAQLRAHQAVSHLPRKSDLGEMWPTLPLWEKRRVVESFLAQVNCYPGTPGRFQPRRLRVEWR